MAEGADMSQLEVDVMMGRSIDSAMQRDDNEYTDAFIKAIDVYVEHGESAMMDYLNSLVKDGILEKNDIEMLEEDIIDVYKED